MTVDEPVLEIDDIQGDVLAGFRKDHVRLVFFQLRADQIVPFKAWLRGYSAKIACVREVSGFNQVYRAMRLRLKRDPQHLAALWRNIGFTVQGLTKLIGAVEVKDFADVSFRSGAEEVSSALGDPTDGSPGSPSTWVIGSGANVPDGLIILAADSKTDLEQELSSLRTDLASFLVTPPYVEIGETLLTKPGHEHFGFKDGVSQPAPRGKNPDGSYFVPRYIDPSDPKAAYFAAPGQALVWHGEFLLNGWKQKGANTDPQEHRTVVDGPQWATNGSYLVFRRLHQRVPEFNAMVEAVFTAMATDPGFPTITRDQVGAMLVGRFKSGCPIMRAAKEDEQLGSATFAANDFNFSTPTIPARLKAHAPIPADPCPPARGDRDGLICPFDAHIRKVNPRDDSTDFGSGSNNLLRRIMRRGIPYGPEFDPNNPKDVDRGLLFLCYQSSIVDQFQTLITDWVNSDTAPKDPSGFDPLISTNSNREFQVKRPDRTVLKVPIPDRLVVATGAAFLFVPPISALRGRLTI